ncbi:MAG TPA: hypothetical protein VMD98_07525 [Bryocella sp.]|nr:hypothetical protein [Bryocella sp.]
MGAITSLQTAVTSAANASLNAAAAPQNQPVQNQPVQSQPSPSAAEDSVELTEAQQVYQLYNQGFPVSAIASSLSLTVDAVNSYLNIPGGTSTAQV